MRKTTTYGVTNDVACHHPRPASGSYAFCILIILVKVFLYQYTQLSRHVYMFLRLSHSLGLFTPIHTIIIYMHMSRHICSYVFCSHNTLEYDTLLVTLKFINIFTFNAFTLNIWLGFIFREDSAAHVK